MNTIHLYIRNICLVAAVALPLVASAQENKTKDNKTKDNSLNREMTLEKEYTPSVGDASKVNTLPAVKEPETRKVPVTYSDYTVPMEPSKEFTLFPSGKYMTDMNYNNRRGYFNFGIGSYMNINGDLGYHILSTATDKFNVYLSHRSTNGNVKYLDSDEKVKAKLNDNLGGFDYAHEFAKLRWNLGGNYSDSRFNYYGNVEVPTTYKSTDVWTYDTQTNQTHRVMQFFTGFESKGDNPFNYLLNLKYVNFNQKYATSPLSGGLTESNFKADFDVNATFSGTGDSQFIGLGGRLNYFGYSLDENSSTYTFDNHAIITLNPYYKVDGGNWHLKLGAIAAFNTGEENKTMIAPDVHIDYNPADRVVLYGYATGELRSNSLYDQAQESRYTRLQSFMPSKNYLDAQIGVRSNTNSGFWFDLFGGYKYTIDELFMSTLYTPYSGLSSSSVATFGNRTHGSLYDASHFYVGTDLKYTYQTFLDARLKLVYNHWNLKEPSGYDSDLGPGVSYEETNTDPINKPVMEIKAGLTIRPIDKLSIDANYYLATGRKTCSYFNAQDASGNFYAAYSEGIKMKNINELNVRGTYTLNDTFGFYVQLNNLLFQKYEYYYGYPMQNFSAMGGININF